eukprot:12561316-Heterocapsa_arctica.AAC.1
MISRILAKLAVTRTMQYFERLEFFVEEQWGFRSGRSTRDVIMITRVLCELYAEWEAHLRAKRSRYEKDGALEEHIAELEAEEEEFQKKRLVLYLADIKKAYPTLARDPL